MESTHDGSIHYSVCLVYLEVKSCSKRVVKVTPRKDSDLKQWAVYICLTYFILKHDMN